MRFCLDFAHQVWTRTPNPAEAVRRTVQLAHVADAAGIDAIWVAEDPDGWDAFAVLGAIAAETRRAMLGSGVVNPYQRDPNLIAASIATLDWLSGGRAALGLGRGQPEWHERGLGKTIGSPLASLEETIGLLRQWWSPAATASSAAGDHFQVRQWERSLRPIQDAPPIFLAAAGPQAIKLAGRMADGVMFNNLTSDDVLLDLIATVRNEARRAGRGTEGLAFILRTQVKVTDDPAPWLERQKNALAIINTLPGMDRLVRIAGFDVDAIIGELRRVMRTDAGLRDGGGFSALRREADFAAARALIPTALVERLAIVGPLDRVRTRLRRLEEIGVTHVSLAPPGGQYDEQTISDLLEALRR